jgi:ABC-type transport system involved in multi-copper enzyme maturation permease subunit
LIIFLKQMGSLIISGTSILIITITTTITIYRCFGPARTLNQLVNLLLRAPAQMG